MKSYCPVSPLDHYLVARVQACVTGANAHQIHSLLGNYHELCLLAAEDETLMERVRRIEGRLRGFCFTGELPEARVA